MNEKTSNAREAVLNALYKVEHDSSYFNFALKEALNHVADADRGFATELMYGVTKRRLTLDYIIMQFSKIRIKKMTPWVRNILRMGVYQMYFMDKIPHSAACNEAVKLAKKHSHISAVKFVNGVLRNISRGIDTVKFPQEENTAEYLSVFYSYPKWMVEKLLSQYGALECEEILKACNASSSPTLRVNRLKITREELEKQLQAEGIHTYADKVLQDCLHVEGRINVSRSKAYREGLCSLQGIGSMQAVLVLDPQPNEKIMDICAAPGGKSCYIAERMKNQGEIYSFDIHSHKIPLIEQNAARLGITIISAKIQDGTEQNKKYREWADRVLVDAPCSGVGVISSKPDIKWAHEESDISALTEIQSKILNTASEYVKPGGILVYSTCTILKEENEEQVIRFLSHHSEFKKCEEIQLLPHKDGGSGFYICKMRKTT